MFCPKCGAQADAGGNYCQKCGAALNQPAGATAPPTAAPVMVNQPAKTSGMAVASLVFGIISLFMGLLWSILAIVFGGIANGQIKRSNGTIKGKGMAMTGIIIGIIGIICSIVVAIVWGYKFFGMFG